jgi:indole-3-glycerol phosphate synthase
MSFSKLDITKHKGRVLDFIMTWKRQELKTQMSSVPLEQARAFSRLSPPPLELDTALIREAGASLIAEIKRASPSRGLIARDWDPDQIAETYAHSGAAAISCLTDSRFFQGKLEYLASVKERLRAIGREIPVLRKDFIFDEYQVYETRMAGADALLLIVAVLSDSQLNTLLKLTNHLGMQALVECHDEADVDRALAAGAKVIGVNNRDLRTFEVDIGTTERLGSRIPSTNILVSESGIRTAEDVAAMAALGCDAVLVGETFCKLPQKERAAKITEFARAGRLVTG